MADTNTDGRKTNHKGVYVIGVSGPSCGGKSTVCQRIVDRIKSTVNPSDKPTDKHIVIFSQDRYYKGGNNETNYDVPDALYFDEMVSDLQALCSGKDVYAPVYDFATHDRKPEKELIKHAPIIIVEGILIFYHAELRNLFDVKIFVTAKRELRYVRRLKRDVEERGRDPGEVEKRYFSHVIPSNELFVEPTMEQSDMTIWNNVEDNFIGLEIIMDHINKKIMDLDV